MKEWIKEGLYARISQVSTTIVFETSDNYRYNEFIDFLKTMKSDGRIRTNEVYIYVDGDKLYKMNNEGELEPIVITNPLGGRTYVRTIEQAIEYMDPILMRKGRTDKDFNIVFTMFLFTPLKPQTNNTPNILEKKIRFYTTYFIKDIKDKEILTNLYENKNTIFILTDNVNGILTPETARYVKVVKVKTKPEERKEIIKKVLKELGNKRPRNEIIERLIVLTSGLNLYETETAVMEAFMRGNGKINFDTIKKIKAEIIEKTGLIKIEDSEYGFEYIGGYEYLKNFVKYNIVKVIKESEKAEKMGLRIPRGILLFGPPGTGKTLFAKALAKETNLPFIVLKVENLMTKWYGETEHQLLNVIEIIEDMSPAIVFIDEIDRFGTRGNDEHEVTRRIFSILLEWLGDKNRKSIIVATTNRPQDLDEAFIRIGRFDYIIPVLYPDEEARKQIFNIHLNVIRKVPVDNKITEKDIEKIVELTQYFTGAEIEEIVQRAIRHAFREDREYITIDDLMKGLTSIRIDIEKRMDQYRRYVELAKTYTNDAEILKSLSY